MSKRMLSVPLSKLLDVALLTYEEQGTVGGMIRERLYAMAGGEITDDEVHAYVDATLDAQFAERLAKRGMTLEQWKAEWERRNPGRSWEEAEANDDDGERRYFFGKVSEIVERMRAGR